MARCIVIIIIIIITVRATIITSPVVIAVINISTVVVFVRVNSQHLCAPILQSRANYGDEVLVIMTAGFDCAME